MAGTLLTLTPVKTSMMAATVSMIISMTAGMPRVVIFPFTSNVGRRSGKAPARTTTATPIRKMIALVFAPFGRATAAAAVPLRGGSISPACSRRWYSGSSASSVPIRVWTKAAISTPSSVDGTQIARMWSRASPCGASRPIMTAVAADTGLAVIACWEAMVATAIGRSGRMPFSWATS